MANQDGNGSGGGHGQNNEEAESLTHYYDEYLKKTVDAAVYPWDRRKVIDLDEYYASLQTKEISFTHLKTLDKDFAAVLKDDHIDFSDPVAVRQLSKTLFKVDYHLELELPENRLCPPTLVRHNYIMWLKELTDSSTYKRPGAKLLGLDIGTGASCVYPLLGCRQRPWSFIATDIDAQNIERAQENIDANSCGDRIKLVMVDKNGPMIPTDNVTEGSLDFTMTNPPFYKSKEEMQQSAAGKARPAPTVCTGAEVEMITEGGEVGFVNRILEESLVLRETVQWYTAMLGHLSSVTAMVEKLHSHGIDNYAIKEFVQGEKTRRWAVGWSFRAMRPSVSAARGCNTSLAKSLLPQLMEATVFRCEFLFDLDEFVHRFFEAVGSLQWTSWKEDEEGGRRVGKTGDRIWSRAWRRRVQQARKRKQGDDPSLSELAPTAEVSHVFGVSCGDYEQREEAEGASPHREVAVHCRWLEGRDVVAFESFNGFLKATAERIQNEMKSDEVKREDK